MTSPDADSPAPAPGGGERRASRSKMLVIGGLVAAGAVVLVFTAAVLARGGSATGSATVAASTTTSPPAATATAAPEDRYIQTLARTGLFPANLTTDARDLWIRYGRVGCRALDLNLGDTVKARFAVFDELGHGQEGNAERAVAIVDAASTHLC